MNELIISEPKTKVELGSIDLENEEILENSIDNFIKRYQGTVVTVDTIKESKSSRAELNKLSKALNEKRKADKKEFLKPLKIYESKIKTMVEKVDKCSNGINVQIKDFEQKEREAKKERVINLIKEMAGNYGVSPDEIEINPKWLNKTTSKKAVIDGIADAMKARKTINDNKTIIEKYAKEHGMDPMYYVDLAEDQSLLEIEKTIDDDFNRKQQREAEEKARHQAEIEAKKTNSIQIGNKLVDQETGQTETLLQEITIKFRGTEEQLDELARKIKKMNIEIVKASERREVTR